MNQERKKELSADQKVSDDATAASSSIHLQDAGSPTQSEQVSPSINPQQEQSFRNEEFPALFLDASHTIDVAVASASSPTLPTTPSSQSLESTPITAQSESTSSSAGSTTAPLSPKQQTPPPRAETFNDSVEEEDYIQNGSTGTDLASRRSSVVRSQLANLTIFLANQAEDLADEAETSVTAEEEDSEAEIEESDDDDEAWRNKDFVSNCKFSLIETHYFLPITSSKKAEIEKIKYTHSHPCMYK